MQRLAFTGEPLEVVDLIRPDHCASIIRACESHPDVKQTVGGPILPRCMLRWEDAYLSKWLWSELDRRVNMQTLVRCVHPDWDGQWRPVKMHGFLKLYRYGVGQGLQAHRDIKVESPPLTSALRLVVYLDEECTGGETVFHFGPVFTPKAGTAILFRQEAMHSAGVVRTGKKHILAADVLCRKV